MKGLGWCVIIAIIGMSIVSFNWSVWLNAFVILFIILPAIIRGIIIIMESLP